MKSHKSFLILLVGMCCMVSHINALSQTCACNSSNSQDCNCSLRTYLVDIEKELHSLSCLERKLNVSVSALLDYSRGTNNNTLILSKRSKQMEKINQAKSQLQLEYDILQSKCSKFSGDNCDGPCFNGYLGDHCDYFTCNGIKNTNQSVCSGHGNCTSPNNCTCSSVYYGSDCQFQPAKSCLEHKQRGSSVDGVYNIFSAFLNSNVDVYCDMTTDGGGWTLINKLAAPDSIILGAPNGLLSLPAISERSRLTTLQTEDVNGYYFELFKDTMTKWMFKSGTTTIIQPYDSTKLSLSAPTGYYMNVFQLSPSGNCVSSGGDCQYFTSSYSFHVGGGQNWSGYTSAYLIGKSAPGQPYIYGKDIPRSSPNLQRTSGSGGATLWVR